MKLGTAQVIRADARSLPLADNSVDLVVTSPPYFGLRSYVDNGRHYDEQIGSEATPAEFVDALVAVTRECVRVLKPSGSLWVNLGDSYSGGNRGVYDRTDINGSRGGKRPTTREHGIRAKSLMGIPWRYALACIDDLGLILRAEVIWSKPNGLPESVTDRVRRSHEQWFHFTLEPRYFSAVDEIREPHAPGTAERARLGFGGKHIANGIGAGNRRDDLADGYEPNPLGKLPGSVWTVPTEPLRVPDHLGVDHFAAFPTEWPKRIIQGWSPAGVCVECGEGRRPIADVERTVTTLRRDEKAMSGANGQGAHGGYRGEVARIITGYACACSPEWLVRCGCGSRSHLTEHHEGCSPPPDLRQVLPPTTPAVVLDPFGGTGTTAMVAKALGRHGISVDMSADYCRLAEWRTNDRDQLAKVLGVAKAEQQDEGQMDMFELLGEDIA